jgi:hypothetical protein
MGDNKDVSQNVGNNSGGSNKKLIILGIVAAVVIVAMAATIVILVLGNNKQTQQVTSAPAASSPEQPKREVLVTEENVEEIIQKAEEQEYVAPGYYTVTQNYDWHFPTGDSPSTDAHVENLMENTNDVYFDLFMADDDDRENPIYQSPVIPLGAVLEGFKLDTVLEAGTYDCIMVYHLVDSEQRSISTVSMTVTVIVEG